MVIVSIVAIVMVMMLKASHVYSRNAKKWIDAEGIACPGDEQKRNPLPVITLGTRTGNFPL
jgi:hypothetical protein